MKTIFQDKKGSALLNVLLVLLMLSIIGGGILTVTANNTRQASLLKAYEGNYYDAEAAVNAGVDAVKTATSKEYARLLANAISNPSNPEYKTITNQTFFGNIRSSALQMLSSEYQAIVNIAMPSSYTGPSSKVEGIYAITATVSDGVLSRTAQATIAAYKIPLAAGGGGQFVDAPLLVNGTFTTDKKITIPNGSLYLKKNISYTQNGNSYKIGSSNNSVVLQNGSVIPVDITQRIWPAGIVAKAGQNQGSLASNMHYINGSVIFEPGKNYDNQIYFVNGSVTFNSGSGSWNLKNTMIFCTGSFLPQGNQSPDEFFFLYSEGSITMNGSASLQNLISYSNYCSYMYNPSPTLRGQMIFDGGPTHFNGGSMNIVFDDAAKQAAGYFYGQIASWSFVGECKPRFDLLAGLGVSLGGGGEPSIPAEDMTGKQSKVVQQ